MLLLAHEHARRRPRNAEKCGKSRLECGPPPAYGPRLRCPPGSPHPDQEKVFSRIEGEVKQLGAKLQEAGTAPVLHPVMAALFRQYLSGGACASLPRVKDALDGLYGTQWGRNELLRRPASHMAGGERRYTVVLACQCRMSQGRRFGPTPP